MDRVGKRLGNYRLTRLLGQGGFAQVYLAEQVYLRSLAAVKVLSSPLAQEGVDGFLTEAQTLVGLSHAHIIRLLDFGMEESTPFLIMDYAPGGTLRQRHPRGKPLPLAVVVKYVDQIAEALRYAHSARLIHRDIKPENLLLGRHDEVLLSDFGIALLAQSSRSQSAQTIAGTISYMAPEQIQGKPRPASDQYALAIVAYEWLCGALPFSGSLAEIAAKHCQADPPPLRAKAPDLPEAIARVVHQALAKDPGRRFAGVHAFATALGQAAKTCEREAVSRAGVGGQKNTSWRLEDDLEGIST
jgi:eukaryotic-like serine/threonine-protein kinase